MIRMMAEEGRDDRITDERTSPVTTMQHSMSMSHMKMYHISNDQ